MSYPVQDHYAPWPSPADSVVDYSEADSFSQTESRIGPSRVVTRGQRRLASQRPSLRSSSRAQSPLIMPATTTTTSYPLTPDSTSYSPYSTYHSRSNSTSNPRSASPALSTVTSVSSHSQSGPTSNHNQPEFLSPFDRNCNAPAATPSHTHDLPATSNPQTRPKQRKQRLFNLDRRAICEFHLKYPTARQEDIATKFKVERSTISKILKHKAKWLNVKPDEQLKVAKHRPSKFPEIESAMLNWISEPATTRRPLSDTRLREKALSVANSYGIGEDRFKASSGWVENFKHRHGIRNGTYEGYGRNAKIARALGMGVEGMEDLTERNVSRDEDHADKSRDDDGDHAYSPVTSTTHHVFNPAALRSHSEQHQSVTEMGLHSQQTPHLPQDHPHHGHHFHPPNHSSGHRQQRYQDHSPTTYQPDSYSYERQSHTSSVPSSSSSQHLSNYPSHIYSGHEMQPVTINTNLPPPAASQTSPSLSIHQVQQLTPVDRTSHPPLAYPEPRNPHQHSPPGPPMSPSGRRMVPQIAAGPSLPGIPPLPPPRLPDNSPPSLQDAEEALNRVILFVDTLPPGQEILTTEQRDNLHDIKCVLFNAGAGVPYK
ncbi:hypothetical protein E1B28_012517 [Marasmius oreades]|uniref:HTH CENPB-type domain-containing protein n=1 Tax=Marasmius oreades TaxID=181124 RepID=A0A9P7UQV7_9AGAR|nr:uncharacterized protein E1B28_012517 [Marasmius oreades]KAG7088534.1 hypothetical protein E1B28_012517 [Marasmius oreades]